ncbi:16S rRNA (uracil(1498)-N(3))-methyltransferase [Ulvibacter litoralis]|uniref:Ribosomal RNA small subunit methyltransferase E n=1 Tax=Ulvibacter litoralis TaxID=227084 RepID=A0A1G7FRE5_9FLAO|nr:16S rRNA (uracil(1498)-N(3))-methyltransferase [Ulvibacter litoralis]GHC50093.1 ribosomal RNA small subunit methyltransferase E [Ulvibacter litoralis]SDE78339.1 16S rRNA (uracil1498-N3)-methyltransferase [Ulvibacter litoralis]
MQLFYNPTISETSKEVVFDKEESRHISKVLRKKEGDILHLTNGKGYFFEAKLLSINPKRCVASVLTSERQEPLSYHLHLAVAPTKLNDRYEWFLEKATEIGISEITPIICDRSERKVIKPERYEKIIQSAMKQSLKAYLPKLNPAISLKEFLTKDHTEKIKGIAHCEDSAKKSLKETIIPNTSILLLIGPEGDFTEKEINLAFSEDFKPITLGDSRLRTETAAIVACHSVYFSLYT